MGTRSISMGTLFEGKIIDKDIVLIRRNGVFFSVKCREISDKSHSKHGYSQL